MGRKLIWALIVLLFILGCASPKKEPSEKWVDIRGNITNILQADKQSKEEGILGLVLIEGRIEEDTKFDKALVTVRNTTHILKEESHQEVAFESLEIGQKVEARFTGPVLESHPVQTTASEIVILK